MALAEDRGHVRAAQQRFNATVGELTEAEARRPSLLSDWTVGHVLTHVARTADSHRRRADGAIEGRVVDQYPGGFEGRAAEIDEGADRPAVVLVADVRESAEALESAWDRVPASAWGQISRDVSGTERALRELPARRWQELEVHAVDLGLGVGYDDWDDAFVATWLERLRRTMLTRLPAGASAPPPGRLEPRAELAWLYGRLRRPDLPVLRPWA
ncbi:MAG TPA: maleylpyruvate isomerase family mycothiol-dependent enzyme [Acidimicrobiia bacterium]|nr:maleylpyruvate isomerase family mycothiol-dependent enzyme [Acidimicrobiia bacterium]